MVVITLLGMHAGQLDVTAWLTLQGDGVRRHMLTVTMVVFVCSTVDV